MPSFEFSHKMQNLLSKIIEIKKLTVWSEWRCIDNLGYFNTLKKYFKIVELQANKNNCKL